MPAFLHLFFLKGSKVAKKDAYLIFAGISAKEQRGRRSPDPSERLADEPSTSVPYQSRFGYTQFLK
ncbi:hypothetical protein ACFSR7_17055 [Cohnella sp. GCM10020058]|uniref:hypothetical protein n=1 Tax=Cohnella sp. GCM10020058 TaxID=3317330 RepID=UPI00363C4F1A